jgi:hypothetical protein
MPRRFLLSVDPLNIEEIESAPAPSPSAAASTRSFHGRLTLQPGRGKMIADQVDRTVLSYSPLDGATIPVIVDGEWAAIPFLAGPTDATGWALNTAQLSSGNYHVFAGPSGLSTAASYDLASGLERADGVLVQQGTRETWLGSINVRAGKMTYHVGIGQDRRCDVFNAHRKIPMALKVQPPLMNAGAGWTPTSQYPAWQPFGGSDLNKCTMVFGEHTEVDVRYPFAGFISTLNGPASMIAIIAWNGAVKGEWAVVGSDNMLRADPFKGAAHHFEPAAIGSCEAKMMSAKANSINSGSVIHGASGAPQTYPLDMFTGLTARWLG